MTIEEIAEAFDAEVVEVIDHEPEPERTMPDKSNDGAKVLALLRDVERETEVTEHTPIDFHDLLRADRPVPEPLITFGNSIFARKGEIVRVAGEPGVGKSFWLLELTMAMGMAHQVAGLSVAPGRVLYLDEEGDEEILAERLLLLQAKPDDLSFLRYLLNQSIRLDHPATRQKVFTHVAEFCPEVIVIDSASRISHLSENDAGEMARLYNDGYKPLSRLFGATVFIIDHLRKGTDGPIDHRVRGSIEKTAQVDRNWILEGLGQDSFRLVHGKTRRGQTPPVMTVRREVEQGGLRHVLEGLG